MTHGSRPSVAAEHEVNFCCPTLRNPPHSQGQARPGGRCCRRSRGRSGEDISPPPPPSPSSSSRALGRRGLVMGEWGPWANEQALASGLILAAGGLVAVAGRFSSWGLAAYAVAAGALVVLLEYPRGQAASGGTVERDGQRLVTAAVAALGPLSRSYYARAALHMSLAVPGGLLLSTVLGAICLAIASLAYLVAAIKGEVWRPVGSRGVASWRGTLREPPGAPSPVEMGQLNETAVVVPALVHATALDISSM
ncbi:cytochrome b-245 light chain isoform X1 [Petromyzon marinus]|uniref:cytochrome b-245 light chain isoform X1 n=1 Tax=Petromyzon marinus TaxID=7757 RepID=UPI003F70FB6C